MDDVVDRLRRAGCVFAEDEATLLRAHAGEAGEDLDALVQRRCTGEPLEYIVGWATFRGLRIAVAEGVFVPRRRTEYLAELAGIYARHLAAAPFVLDLCCGAGAIAASVHDELPAARLYCSDIDPVAVDCAHRNLGSAAQLFVGDLFEPLPRGLRNRVHVLVANAPYVPSDSIALMPPEAREHERRAALDGGDDGLDIVRRVFAAAPEWLAPGGTVLVEMGSAQAIDLTDTVAAFGLTVNLIHHEEYGETVLAGTRARA